MTIAKEVIEQVKRTDLVALAAAKGIELKKNGKSWFGLCPFHADKNPSLSINPTKNLFQCFGCGAAGDAIRFVELFDQVDFKEAVKRLFDNGFKSSAPKGASCGRAAKAPAGLTVKERKLLARVVGHYQHTLSADSRGLNYLKQERGIADNQSIKDFGAGYANGTLLEILPDDPDIIKALKKIGILNAKGSEMFYNCVVFPLGRPWGRPKLINLTC
jgi:DNA primase